MLAQTPYSVPLKMWATLLETQENTKSWWALRLPVATEP